MKQALDHILRQLIARSFPSLRRARITISWGTGEELLYYADRGSERAIVVNDCLSGAARRALEGGIAHELCHIEADLSLGPYQRQLAWDYYAQSRWYRMKEERRVERRAIELGYGTHLLELIRFARRLGYSFSREHGLLYAEIARAEALRTRESASAAMPLG